MRRWVVPALGLVLGLVLALVLALVTPPSQVDRGMAAAATVQPEAAGRASAEQLAADVFDDYADLFGADRSYFPLGVWFESVTSKHDVATDKRANLNLYVVLTDNTDLSLVRAAGMRAVPTLPCPAWGPKASAGSSTTRST